MESGARETSVNRMVPNIWTAVSIEILREREKKFWTEKNRVKHGLLITTFSKVGSVC